MLFDVFPTCGAKIPARCFAILHVNVYTAADGFDVPPLCILGNP